ncbi:hypothetical protein [Demequina zhanjiangensis]|uniref:Uncharacterized protein n=1 Tax=Demequina zhanjiangensis TaxID=3051659 RepID=A0ABT8FYP6_9MICO|nr:hypothetical protein [Demequina sp. SYSU T00b26]MDN4471962.1 hypothetical protein [Demequina sp. SYSU T00b26]
MTSSSAWTIHPALTIEVVASRRRYHRYFENEYARMATGERPDAARITAAIVQELPDEEPGDVRRSLRFKKIFTYDYVVRGLETDHVRIYFRDQPLARVYTNVVTLFLQAQVIEPVAYLKLLERNILFMHAAGVTKGRDAYLFPAFGGTGKTTLTLGLMGEGMRVLGDDLLLVDASSGEVRRYLRPLHLFAYNIRTLRGAEVPWLVRAQVRTKDLMRAVLEPLTRQEFLISTRVHAEELYEDFKKGKRSTVRRIVFLLREGEDHALSTTDDLAVIVDRILESEDLNDSLYANVLNSDQVEDVVALERNVIGHVIGHVDHVSFVNTRKLDFDQLSGFKTWLLSDIGDVVPQRAVS